MKIAITGNMGFIGSNLHPLLEKNYGKLHVIGYDLKSGYDIFDKEFEERIKWTNMVIHLAALTNVNQSFKNPGEVFRVNVLGTARIVELCMKYKKKLIFPSSAAIYHRELSPYAESKALAEDIVRSAMKSIPITILRLYNVFGPGMNPDSGSIMYNFLNDKRLVVYGDGEQTRDYIHVRDVVSIIEDALKAKWNGKIVDVGTGQAYSTNYVAGLFAYYRRKGIYYKAPRREIKWSIADLAMLRTLYKKSLTTNLEVDIRELCKRPQLS